MTEQEFQTQVWRSYDKITLADGVPGKVLGVNFTTKSVRAFISGAPEWVRCELIETHTTGKDKNCNDITTIEELQKKVQCQAMEINRLQEEKKLLTEKLSRNYHKDLLTAVNMMKEGIQEKKNKIAKVDRGLQLITDIVEKLGIPESDLPTDAVEESKLLVIEHKG